MAKRRFDSTTYDGRSRGTIVTATQRVRPTLDIGRFLTFRVPVSPIIYDDRRTFHPDDPYRAPWASPRYAAQLVAKNGSRSKVFRGHKLYSGPPIAVGFRRPDRVAFCVKRKSRRQVLLALGRGGRNKPGKRNYTSQFSCS